MWNEMKQWYPQENVITVTAKSLIQLRHLTRTEEAVEALEIISKYLKVRLRLQRIVEIIIYVFSREWIFLCVFVWRTIMNMWCT